MPDTEGKKVNVHSVYSCCDEMHWMYCKIALCT